MPGLLVEATFRRAAGRQLIARTRPVLLPVRRAKLRLPHAHRRRATASPRVVGPQWNFNALCRRGPSFDSTRSVGPIACWRLLRSDAHAHLAVAISRRHGCVNGNQVDGTPQVQDLLHVAFVGDHKATHRLGREVARGVDEPSHAFLRTPARGLGHPTVSRSGVPMARRSHDMQCPQKRNNVVCTNLSYSMDYAAIGARSVR